MTPSGRLGKANALEALRSGPVRAVLEGLRESSRAFFGCLAKAASTDTRRSLSDADMTAAVRAAYAALDLRLEAVEAMARSRPEEALQVIAQRAGELRDDLLRILTGERADDEGELADLVRWIDVRSRSVSLGASPIDVGSTLRARLFDRVPSVVCTSATLATGSSFHFARARLGAPPGAVELVVPSPFDFASNAVLYLPEDLPEPAEAGFEDAACERIAQLVAMTDGGAFVLCTSTRAMRSMHEKLRSRTKVPLLLQGERPKHALLDRFRTSGRAVLVATMSFWEGVDVPGWALRLVVIDKIPFAPPHDPVVLARCSRLDREGGSGFAQYSIPSAAMTLKQGFGRLIRSQRDFGVVAVLDRRIVRKGYGRALLAALPPARRVRNQDELQASWAALAERAAESLAPRVSPC